MKSSQGGFTLIELVVVSAVIGLLMWLYVPNIWEPINDAKIRGGVSQAKEIVFACDLVRVTPVSTSRDTTSQKVTKVYGGAYTNWTDVSVLRSKLSTNYTLPTINPFGRPYYFKMTDGSCSVALELDELIDGWEGYELETVGARTRIIIGTPARSMAGPSWVKQQGRFLTGETAR